MRNPLLTILKTGLITQRKVCPDVPDEATGLPMMTQSVCTGCDHCATVCPTHAITVRQSAGDNKVELDLGLCLGCNACVEICPSATIIANRSTRIAVRIREDLILCNYLKPENSPLNAPTLFHRSMHVREVSTGCNAADLEIIAGTNAQFDVARFGIHFVPSPRFADALLITGPVGRAMHEPLRRCYNAMAEPRIVIAAGTSAISGGVHRGGYADANGAGDILPIDVFIPGEPPHPWSIIHGLLLAMGRI